jgi:hypothetical protein
MPEVVVVAVVVASVMVVFGQVRIETVQIKWYGETAARRLMLYEKELDEGQVE